MRNYYTLIGATVIRAVGSASAQTAVLACNAVLVVSTTNCHLAFGADPTATTNSFYLPANVPIAISIDSAHKIAAIRNTADGNLYITPIA